MDPLLGFTLSLLIAAAVATLLNRINVSPVAGYIIAGLLIGPVFNAVDPNSEYITIASNIGIALIAFEIGLTAKLGFLRRHGHEIGMTALIEFAVIAFLVAAIGVSIGFPIIVSVILGLMALNTSTAIAFKMVEAGGRLTERSMLRVLSVGTIEDIIVMTGISLIPAFSQLGSLNVENVFYQISFVVITVLVVLIVSLQVMPKIFSFVSKGNEQEITVLLLLATAIGFGWLGNYMGISFSLGAFIAGLVISSVDLPREVMDRMVSLRDLFAILFFISIGLAMPRIESLESVAYAAAIAVAIIGLKFFSFTSAAWLIGRNLEKAIRIGFYMIPISEFALIVANEGYRYGFIDNSFFMASAFAVITSVILASILVKNDEYYAGRAASAVPERIKRSVETFSARVTGFLIGKMFREGEGRRLLLAMGSKIAVIIVITAIGSLLIQILNEIPLFPDFLLVVQAGIATMVGLIVLTEMVRLGHDINKTIEVVLKIKGQEANRALKAFRDAVYLFILLAISSIAILSAAALVRKLFQESGGVTANILSFTIIISFTLIAFLFSYSRIRKMLEALEGIINRI
ncbi:MAG: cation:proton antiporter [Candidatus Methanosuratincola petrocarbonis]